MKSNISKRNLALIRFSVIVFIILLALYIPLKIHISKEEGSPPIEHQVRFDMMITRNLSCALTRGGGCASGERIAEIIENNNPSLLIDYMEITPGLLKAGARMEDLPIEKLKKTGYHAVVPVISDENPPEVLSGSFRLLQLPLPLTSANIVPGREGGNNLSQWIIAGIEGQQTKTGERREIKAGIFSISPADSVQPEYSRFNKYNIINPKIAALEAINRMKREGCHIVIAVCGAGGERELLGLPGIDIILEKAGQTTTSSSKQRVKVNFGGSGLPADIFRVFYSADSIRVSRVEY
ncbi:MAG: hypothetical protein R6U43_06210 [Candidatus Krumholzibacteriales bacterium]